VSLPAVGVGLPIVGRHAGPEVVRLLATTADRLGFSSVSVAERLVLPGAPGWSNDFGLPESPAYDALETLSWVAAITELIGLRTDVLLPLFQNPVVVARRLATLDHLSGGRVGVAMGIGWLPEEFAATGTPMAGRGDRFEECVAAIRACWGPDPVEHHGEHYDVPLVKLGPKPLRGAIPIEIGALAPPALARAARIGDGVCIGFRDWDSTTRQLDAYRAAGGNGRVVVRAGPMLADAQHAEPTTAFDEDHVVEDLHRMGEHGVDELIWDLNIVERPPAQQVAACERLAAALGLG
jgi:probable F420-dependent oxidoreductase